MRDPRTGEVIEELWLSTVTEVAGAAARAGDAAPRWAATPVERRCELVGRLASSLERVAPELARRLSVENGKTVVEAEVELERGVETLRWAAGIGPGVLEPERLPGSAAGERWLEAEPIGPVLAVVPANFPAVVLARKLGPALVAGCPVVAKMPETVPCIGRSFEALVREVGFPEGAFSSVHTGPEGTRALVEHRSIRCVTFTGSTELGRLVAAWAATTLTPCVLELGGHAPVIISEDAHLDETVAALAAAKFASAGQSCNAPSRMLVDRRIAEPFIERFTRAAPLLDHEVYADGRAGTLGPLMNERRRGAVHDLVEDARARGAVLHAGGEVPSGPGWYYPATVLSAVPLGAAVLEEEPFGPVAPILTFEDDAEAVALANGSPYGLSAYLFGDPERMTVLARALHVGRTSINTAPGAAADVPLGGRGASGYGYEGGPEGILAFAPRKLLQRAQPAPRRGAS